MNIAPMALKVFEDNKEVAMKCEVTFNGDTWIDMLEGKYKHIFNLRTIHVQVGYDY